jgi:hypothetical protein
MLKKLTLGSIAVILSTNIAIAGDMASGTAGDMPASHGQVAESSTSTSANATAPEDMSAGNASNAMTGKEDMNASGADAAAAGKFNAKLHTKPVVG